MKKAKRSHNNDAQDPTASDSKLKFEDYERELASLHIELVKLQQWTVHKGLTVCVVFEGRDGAGKGGAIKAITERVSLSCRAPHAACNHPGHLFTQDPDDLLLGEPALPNCLSHSVANSIQNRRSLRGSGQGCSLFAGRRAIMTAEGPRYD